MLAGGFGWQSETSRAVPTAENPPRLPVQRRRNFAGDGKDATMPCQIVKWLRHSVFWKLTRTFGVQRRLEFVRIKKEKLGTSLLSMYTQALLIEGVAIEDPVGFSNQICELMTQE